MRQFLLTLSYDGSSYRGWQRQGNTENTIQAKVAKVIERAFETSVDLQGASRTDAGVHAIGQRASFKLATDSPPQSIMETINRYLPKDLAVTDCEEVSPSFHVRHQVVSKNYCYRLHESDKPNVFTRAYEWTTPGPLDVRLMTDALQCLVGKHDFQGFTVGNSSKKTTRTIERIWLEETATDLGRLIDIHVSGDGFLHHMIRLIVGTVVAIGRGEVEVDRLETVLHSKNRSLAILAPAQGLCLLRVTYRKNSA